MGSEAALQIEYIPPLLRAWERTKRALLTAPIDVGAWFAVGFAAWLSSLAEGGGGGGGPRWLLSDDPGRGLRDVRHGIERFLENAFWIGIGIGAVLVILAIWVLFLWISSRAKFVFLEAVVHGGKAIVEPWHRYAALGNSLFLWRLGFAAVVAGCALVAIGPPLAAIALLGDRFPPVVWVFGAVTGVLGLALALAFLYVAAFLEHLVVPVMYRDGLTAADAWRRLIPLLRGRTGDFLLFGLFLFVVVLAIALVVAAGTCATCCVLGCILAVPYINAVVFLPVTYTLRGFGPEFLAQYGPEWSIFPAPAPDGENP